MSSFRLPLLRGAKAMSRGNNVSIKGARSLFTTYLYKRKLIAEGNPVSSYTTDGRDQPTGSAARQYSISVRGDPSVKAKKIVPLAKSVHQHLSPIMKKLSVMDKLAVVTGGARGLGNNIARAFAEAGARAIAIFDANQELGEKAAAELHEQTGLPVQFYKVDVRDGSALTEAVNSVVDQFGAPDILVNAAGIADSNIKAEEYDHDMFRRLIDINLNGSFLAAQAVGKAMMAAHKPGSIILIASMSGSIVNYPQEQSSYNASKAGVIQLGKSLAAEWAKHDIRVNCISPGYMDTELIRVPALDVYKKIWVGLTPQKRLGAIDDLNGLAVFLASDASAYMTGSNVIIDGGYTLW